MQFQSDISGLKVQVPNQEELSGIGAAYLAGISLGLWNEEIFSKMKRNTYSPVMDEKVANEKYAGWKAAVEKV
jgi:glycerol kinase